MIEVFFSVHLPTSFLSSAGVPFAFFFLLSLSFFFFSFLLLTLTYSSQTTNSSMLHSLPFKKICEKDHVSSMSTVRKIMFDHRRSFRLPWLLISIEDSDECDCSLFESINNESSLGGFGFTNFSV